MDVEITSLPHKTPQLHIERGLPLDLKVVEVLTLRQVLQQPILMLDII